MTNTVEKISCPDKSVAPGPAGPPYSRSLDQNGRPVLIRRSRDLRNATLLAAVVNGAPRAVLTSAAAIALMCGLVGASVVEHLGSGGYNDPAAESSEASRLLAERFSSGPPNLVILVTDPAGVDTPPARAEGEQLVSALRERSDVTAVQSYWQAPSGLAVTMRSTDGTSAIVTGTIAGDDTTQQPRVREITDKLSGTRHGVTVRVGGFSAQYQQVNARSEKDLVIAEAIALPITAILLVWLFGSLVAAALPLTVGLFSMVTTLGILRGLTLLTDVSTYALNMTTVLGLALAIDYSLLTVSRFREELERGLAVPAAVARTVTTAGRTILFSAAPVAVSLSALALFPIYFLRSFAYAGVAVVAAAALAAVLALPAALLLIGHRVNALDIRVPVRRWLRVGPPKAVDVQHSFWYRFATRVTRSAGPAAISVIALLLMLGAPVVCMRFGNPDDRVITNVAQSRQVGDILRQDFKQDPTATTVAVLPDFGNDRSTLAKYASSLSKVHGVVAVSSGAGTFAAGQQVAPASPAMGNSHGTYLTISARVDPYSAAGASLLEQLRATPPPAAVLFTGAAALNHDTLAALRHTLPPVVAVIVLATLVLLFLLTGSVVLPVKALLLNTLSLSATFGAMVWIFQQGHLSHLLGFTAIGYLNPTMPILMFCLAFGVSMDYEVFVLSRIREEWLASNQTAPDNTHAVALGIARTGRVVTAAAVLMATVLFAMVSSKISFMQMFGLGLTLMVLADATLVRMILVPAFMQMFGRFNWWAPRPLAWLHQRIGVSEAPTDHELARADQRATFTAPR
jgi:RND superfamily putative drug exporter